MASVFSDTISYEAQTIDGPLEYRVKVREALVNMTLRRPRDLQEIVRQIDEQTKDARRSFPDEQIILDAFDQYSVELRQSVEKEYKVALPVMEEILTRFAGNDTKIDRNTLIYLIGEVVGHEDESIYKAASVLFEACVIGAVRKNFERPVIFYYDFQNFVQLWKTAKEFGFHPAFWHSLQLVSLRSRRRSL